MKTALEKNSEQLYTRSTLWQRFKRDRTALVALAVLLLFILVALLADQIAPRDPLKTSAETLQSPSLRFLFGTDDLGRDIFSGVVHGARTSLLIAISVTAISSIIGVVIGMTAGYAGGLLDDLLMRVTELFLIPPRFFLAVIVAAVFGPSFLNLILILSLTYWPQMARLVRAEVMSLKQRGFVEAARAAGAGPARILAREIFPNALPLIVTNLMLKIGGVILIEAGLEFLGLGNTNHISWGYMLHNGQHFTRDAWWMIAFPALALSLLVLALNLVADELNRALDPKARGTLLKEAV